MYYILFKFLYSLVKLCKSNFCDNTRLLFYFFLKIAMQKCVTLCLFLWNLTVKMVCKMSV